MSAVEPVKVEVAVTVGSGINAYVVNVIAWQEASGSLQVQLAPNKNGNQNSEETALRQLQRDPASVLKQVNRALKKAGVQGVDDSAEVIEAKVLPGPNVPLHKNDPRLTPDFLATLSVFARMYGKNLHATEDVIYMVKECFALAGVEISSNVTLEPFTDAELEAAERLDGKAPTIDGVMPPEENKTQQ